MANVKVTDYAADTSPSDTDILWVTKDPSGTPLDRQVAIGDLIEGTAVKSTGETGGDKFLREDGDGSCSWQTPAGGGGLTPVAATVTTGNTTGVEGQIDVLDISGMTADRDWSLPTPSAAGVECGVQIITDAPADYELVLKRNAVKFFALLISGEILTFRSTGTGATDWVVVNDGRIPCFCEQKNSSSQTLSNATNTKMELPTSVSDNANMSDTTNDRIKSRRGTLFSAKMAVRVATFSVDGTCSGYIWQDGSSTAILDEAAVFSGRPATVNATSNVTLTEGVWQEFYVRQQSGSDKGTTTGGVDTVLSFLEILQAVF